MHPEPTGQREKVQRIAVGLTATLGLFAFGLWVSGAQVRALTVAVTGAEGELEPVPGSRLEANAQQQIDGEETLVRSFHVRNLTPHTVLERYRDVAHAACSPRDLPYLLQEHPDGAGFLLWVDPEDGARRAVIVERDPRGGTLYRLLEAEAPAGPAQRELPGRIPLPDGARAVFSQLQEGGGGMALLQAPGSPRAVATSFVERLEGAGWAVEGRERALLQASGRDEPERVAIPFTRGQRRGLLVVAGERGRARVMLTVR